MVTTDESMTSTRIDGDVLEAVHEILGAAKARPLIEQAEGALTDVLVVRLAALHPTVDLPDLAAPADLVRELVANAPKGSDVEAAMIDLLAHLRARSTLEPPRLQALAAVAYHHLQQRFAAAGAPITIEDLRRIPVASLSQLERGRAWAYARLHSAPLMGKTRREALLARIRRLLDHDDVERGWKHPSIRREFLAAALAQVPELMKTVHHSGGDDSVLGWLEALEDHLAVWPLTAGRPVPEQYLRLQSLAETVILSHVLFGRLAQVSPALGRAIIGHQPDRWPSLMSDAAVPLPAPDADLVIEAMGAPIDRLIRLVRFHHPRLPIPADDHRWIADALHLRVGTVVHRKGTRELVPPTVEKAEKPGTRRITATDR